MMLGAHFIDPLFNSLYYMQSVLKLVPYLLCVMLNDRLNIFYLILERMNGFAEEHKFDITNSPGSQIASDYEQQRTDAWSQIEELNIAKRIVSVGTCKSLCHSHC